MQGSHTKLSPVLLSSAAQRDQSATHFPNPPKSSGARKPQRHAYLGFSNCLLGKLLPRIRQARAELCGYMGGKSNLPCEFSPWYPKKGKKYLPPLYRFVGTTPNSRLFGSTIPNPESPVQLGTVLCEGREIS